MNPTSVALASLVSVVPSANGSRIGLRVLPSDPPGSSLSDRFSAPEDHEDVLASQIRELSPPVARGVFAPPPHCARCLLDASPYPAMAFDPYGHPGRILTANAPFVKEMLPAGAALPHHVADCFPPDMVDQILAVPQGKTLYFREVAPPVPNGFVRTYDLHARHHAFPDGRERPVGLLFFAERTDRRRLEDRLRESEDIRRVLEGTTTEAILRTTPEGTITYVSPSGESLTGYKPEDVIGRSVYEFIHPEEAERLTRTHEAILRKGALTVFEHRIRHKDGSWRWIETRARAVRHPQTEEILEIHTSQRDLTDLKRGKQERELALEAELSATKFAARSLAHDLNNIFAVLLTNHEFLREAAERLSEEGNSEGALDELKLSAQELHEVSERAVQILRDFRRSDHGASSVSVDLNVLLRPSSLALLLGSRQNLAVSLSENPVLVPGPAGDLIRLIDNLVVNAREAMSGVENPRLSVSVEPVAVDESMAAFLEEEAFPFRPRRGSFVRIRIRDNGKGMTEQVRRRIFEEGFSTKMGVGAQRGDGLAKVAKCVEERGGFLTVASVSGQGTTFEVYLPAH